jgi:hypothetical protein
MPRNISQARYSKRVGKELRSLLVIRPLRREPSSPSFRIVAETGGMALKVLTVREVTGNKVTAVLRAD